MKRAICSVLLILLSVVALAQHNDASSLRNETFLHPMDGFTAYTLEKNEIVYCQSPFTLPMPSWAWWGITDRLTCEIDLLPLLGGLFQKPHWPVPSFNVRYRLLDQKGWVPTVAFETMYQHLWTTQNQSDQSNLRVERQGGNSWFGRFNFSWHNKGQLHFHFSAGVTYTENLLIENKDEVNYEGVFFSNTINPDVSFSLDWRSLHWLSCHLTTSYGTTFVYLDNIPRKYQLSYGFRLAPFYKNRWGILRTFRAELVGFYMYLPDAGEAIESVVPIFPYFYWQFDL